MGEITTSVRVLVAYDLGGVVQDVSLCSQILNEAYPGTEFDTYALRSFNLSYLSRHDPVITFDAGEITARIGGKDYTASRTCYVYPWLGVLHIELDFNLDSSAVPSDLLAFYDHFVQWKNRDYLPYLERSGAMNHSLKIATVVEGDDQRSFVGPLAEIYESVEVLLEKILIGRPNRYAFHDFRTVVISNDPEFRNAVPSSQLLDLADEQDFSPVQSDFSHPGIWLSDTYVATSGWVTLVSPGIASPEETTRNIGLVLRLIHAQWFVCQAWIHVLSLGIAEEAVDVSQRRLYDLAQYRGRFDADFIEVDNVDLMLKDPRLIRMSEIFIEGFKLRQHKDAAEARFESVAISEAKRIEEQRTKEAQRLQLLFSISAAVAIAGLIPVLAQTETPLAIATLVVVIVLGLAFMVNIALIFRRILGLRRQRNAAKARQSFNAEMAGG